MEKVSPVMGGKLTTSGVAVGTGVTAGVGEASSTSPGP